MRGHALAFAAGALFAVGLALSGMTDASKVQGFLDVTGAWDPSLMLVMVGAIGVHAVAARLVKRPLLVATLQPRPTQGVDARLLAGAALFGAGWGLGGYCPGPAFVSAGALSANALVFVLAMSAGMALHRYLHLRSAVASSPA